MPATFPLDRKRWQPDSKSLVNSSYNINNFNITRSNEFGAMTNLPSFENKFSSDRKLDVQKLGNNYCFRSDERLLYFYYIVLMIRFIIKYIARNNM